MKHTVQITLLLVLIFLASQLIGLVTLNNYYGHDSQGNVEYKDLPMSLERPEVEDKTSGFFIFFAVIIGTLLLLLLVKLKSRYITKGWFFLAMFLALLLAFNGYIDEKIALTLALVFAIWKVFFPNPYIHNLTEIFIYGGIAVLFHEMLSVTTAIILLIAIAIYDVIAVNKIKHMITLAKYQTEQNLFAGAMIPYFISKKRKKKTKTKKKVAKLKTEKRVATKQVKTAILGGGDMAFPLLLAGAVLKEYSLIYALIPVVTSTAALAIHLFKAEKGKFYPAMPILAAGSIIGTLLVMIIT